MRLAFLLNEWSIYAQYWARQIMATIYGGFSGAQYHSDLVDLHRRIRQELSNQRREYRHFIYEWGYPYQGLSILGIYGTRPTEERFLQYGLAELIKREDRVLDIGCNCGFMLIYTAYRTGCLGEGIDINPYMINVGKHTCDFLGLSERVRLSPIRFQDFQPEARYNVIFSFASHWTDDEQHRPDFDNYMHQLHVLMEDGGILVFESHSAEVGKPDFYERMHRQAGLFSFEHGKLLENGRRELFIMHKR